MASGQPPIVYVFACVLCVRGCMRSCVSHSGNTILDCGYSYHNYFEEIFFKFSGVFLSRSVIYFSHHKRETKKKHTVALWRIRRRDKNFEKRGGSRGQMLSLPVEIHLYGTFLIRRHW